MVEHQLRTNYRSIKLKTFLNTVKTNTSGKMLVIESQETFFKMETALHVNVYLHPKQCFTKSNQVSGFSFCSNLQS